MKNNKKFYTDSSGRDFIERVCSFLGLSHATGNFSWVPCIASKKYSFAGSRLQKRLGTASEPAYCRKLLPGMFALQLHSIELVVKNCFSY